VWDGVQTDNTGQMQVHEDLRRSLDTLRAILDAAPTGIVVSDVEGRVILASTASERLSRGLLTPGASLPDLSHTLITPDGVPVPPERQPLARALKGEEVSDVELQFRGKDGRESITTVYATPLRGPDGAIWAAVTVFLDITRRKHAEKAVQEADRRKDEFLAILSHELRNPLAAIRYALPLLARQTAPEAKERAVGVIDRQATHLARLVDDLLDISRITSDKIELRRERVPLASIVAAAVEAAAPAVAAGRHDLRTSLGEEEIWVDADPARLAQVITNLLANSAKCTPRPGEIVLEAVREAGQAVVRVRDTGVGLSPEALATVFDMFRQVPHLNKASGGLGVGLALARRLVEMHGGTLEARSEGEGRGAEFTIRIPVAEPVKAAADTGRPAAPAASRRLKVLVVDDNADLLEMLSLFVEIAGHEVRKALDGRSALAAAAAFRPDVVLLDLGLPVMNGLEVAREMRRRAETAGARLVALTGWGQARDRAETRAAGFDRHLTKPTDAETLEALLAEYARE
jgi:PAS domain S-box-containing protein